MERLGLKAPAKRIVDVAKYVKPDRGSTESTDTSIGTLPTSSIGKYCYKLIPSDLKREQQVFEASEGVSIYIYIYVAIHV